MDIEHLRLTALDKAYLGWLDKRLYLVQEQEKRGSNPDREQEIKVLSELIRIVHAQKSVEPIGEVVDLTQLFYYG